MSFFSANAKNIDNYSDFSAKGIKQWPNDPEETEGYIFLEEGLVPIISFFPEHITLFNIPKNVKSHLAANPSLKLIGSFHSHPHGCTKNKCYYQPPSVTDFNSVHTICDTLGYCEHVVITKDFLFVIKFTRHPDIVRFTRLMDLLETLRIKNLDPPAHESEWNSIVEQYTDIVQIERIPTPVAKL